MINIRYIPKTILRITKSYPATSYGLMILFVIPRLLYICHIQYDSAIGNLALILSAPVILIVQIFFLNRFEHYTKLLLIIFIALCFDTRFFSHFRRNLKGSFKK